MNGYTRSVSFVYSPGLPALGRRVDTHWSEGMGADLSCKQPTEDHASQAHRTNRRAADRFCRSRRDIGSARIRINNRHHNDDTHGNIAAGRHAPIDVCSEATSDPRECTPSADEQVQVAQPDALQVQIMADPAVAEVGEPRLLEREGSEREVSAVELQRHPGVAVAGACLVRVRATLELQRVIGFRWRVSVPALHVEYGKGCRNRGVPVCLRVAGSCVCSVPGRQVVEGTNKLASVASLRSEVRPDLTTKQKGSEC